MTARSNGRLGVDVNDLVVILVSVAAANIWAQSGLRGRDAAILAGLLAVYDPIATNVLSLTGSVFTRLDNGLRTSRRVVSEGQAFCIGQGDLIVATLLPLCMLKAYGTTSGIVTAGLTSSLCVASLALATSGVLDAYVPVMALVGPAAVANYAVWRRRQPRERRTFEFRSSIVQNTDLLASGAGAARLGNVAAACDDG